MIHVLERGVFTTVQDLGRISLGHLGVPAAGAADPFSLRVANRLVGNMDGAAALEMTGRGDVLRFDAPADIALAGGDMEATLDGQPLPMHQTIRVMSGAVLHGGPIRGGFRVYLAVGGGLSVPQVLGSASCDTLAGLGPAPLEVGTQIPVAPQPDRPGFYLRAPPSFGDSTLLRVLPGPQEDWFAASARRRMLETEYRVLPQSDRTGLRLTGEKLERSRKDELPSMGMVTGAIQVPASGQPIALLANHGATGGYPVIANIISADLGLLAQLAPGAHLRFSLVTRAEALSLLKMLEERLVRDMVPADAGLLAARALIKLAGRYASLKQAAVTEGGRKIRIRRGN
jgi:biotin-dependent carboxylase-like uncharacterized protein